MSAPTNVMGRLRRRPTTAAAKPFSARSVSCVDVRPVCPMSGAMSTPARAASMKPSTQPICDNRYGLAPASSDQIGVIDHRPHGHAQSGPAQEQPEPDTHHRRDDHNHDLLVLQRDPVGSEQAHRQHRSVRLGEEGRDGTDDVRTAPENGGHPEQNHEKAERDHQRPLDGGPVDTPEQHELDDEPQNRRLDEDDERNGEQERPVLVLPQLPVGEGCHHPHGTLGEVEDARGVVGHDQADGQDAVDSARRRCRGR